MTGLPIAVILKDTMANRKWKHAIRDTKHH